MFAMNKADIEIATFIFRSIQKYIEDGLTSEWIKHFIIDQNPEEFKKWNNFISSRIMPIAQILEQEFSRKLLVSPDYFFRFNVRSLYNYSLEETIKAGAEMVDRMAMTRNEWRSWVGLTPHEGMDELLALENYIPADRLGDQKKLNGGGE